MRFMNEGGKKKKWINYLNTSNVSLDAFFGIFILNILLKNRENNNTVDTNSGWSRAFKNKVEKFSNKFYPKINYDILDVK